jgi:hypothetical protein
MDYNIVNQYKKVFTLAVVIFLTFPQLAHSQPIYQNGLTLSAGMYSASGFGTNPYFGARYNRFLGSGKFFSEISFGFSSLKSKVLENVANFQIFESNNLYAYEFSIGYDANPSGNLPYLLAGVAGVNQGGQSNFAYVIGLGKQIPLSKYFNTKSFGFRYDIRDQIFSQRINNGDSFISHNIIFTIGFQFYF